MGTARLDLERRVQRTAPASVPDELLLDTRKRPWCRYLTCRSDCHLQHADFEMITLRLGCHAKSDANIISSADVAAATAGPVA